MCAIQTKYTEINETFLIKSGEQLQQYLEGNRKYLIFLYYLVVQSFKRCLRVLQTIPYGETWSYKQVAEKVGSPKAARAVGMAIIKILFLFLSPAIGL